jgi:hypothetical protein
VKDEDAPSFRVFAQTKDFCLEKLGTTFRRYVSHLPGHCNFLMQKSLPSRIWILRAKSLRMDDGLAETPLHLAGVFIRSVLIVGSRAFMRPSSLPF